jgi:anti-sigma factor RsiW
MNHEDFAPSPEQLAAFVDGNLDADLHRRVEAWLAAHPEEAAEVAAHRQLARAWRDTTPAEPSPAAWDAVLARIQTGSAPVATGPSGTSRRVLPWGTVTAATAAAVLWAAFSLRDAGSPPPGEPPRAEAWEPLVLASPGDVEIMSVAAEDTDAVLVGDPPLKEALVLASSGDVTVQSVAPDVDGVIPDMSGMTGQASPMIVAPLPAVPPKDADR